MEKPRDGYPMPATVSGFRSADFPLGSIESRTAARILIEATRSKEASSSLMVREKVKDPLIWLQNHTQTKDLAEAVRPLAEHGDLTSCLIRWHQMTEDPPRDNRPARLGRYRR